METTISDTQKKLQRLSNDWTYASGEEINVEILDKSSVMAKCSELAAFRIMYDYYKGKNKNLSKSYSSNLNSFVLILEISI